MNHNTLLTVKYDRRTIHPLKKPLSKKKLEFEDLGNSQLIHIAKMKKVCSSKNTKGVLAKLSAERLLMIFISRRQEESEGKAAK